MKTTRDHVHIIDAYNQLENYPAAAELRGTSDKTVKGAVERQQAGGPWTRRTRRSYRPWVPLDQTTRDLDLADAPSRLWIKCHLPR